MPSPRAPRRILLILLLLAGLTGLTAVPASAATARTLSIKVSTTTPLTKASVTVSGTLSRSPKGTVVTVQRKSGTRWVKAAATRTTTAKGAYKVKITVPANAARYSYRASAAKTSKLKAATSKTVTIDVRRKVAITSTLTPTTVGTGSTTVLSGTVAPGVVGSTVTIQRISGSTISTVTTTKQTAGGSYSATITPPAAAGTYTYRASTAGRTGYAAATSPSRSVVVTAAPVAPVISTTSLPSGRPSQPYAATLTTDGNQPGTWSVTPALPSGLSLDATTGAISGVPTAASQATYTFTFTHQNGLTDAKALALGIFDAPTITTRSLPTTSKGSTYSVQLQASQAGTWQRTSGSLPAGVTLSSKGVLSGTVTAANGTSQLTVRFTSTASGLTDDASFTIDVKDYIATSGLPAASSGQPYAYQLQKNGSIAGTWTSLGAPPTGLSLDPDGTLSGTPQGSGSTLFIVQFTPSDTRYAAASANLVFTVEGPMPSTFSSSSVDAGNQFACRVQASDAKLACWGYNLQGNLGIGDYSYADAVQSSPRTIAGSWRSVATGSFYSACAVKTDDSLWCWGGNREGTVGDGTAYQANAPRQVTSGTKKWSSVTVGAFHVCAVTTTGSLWCWGSNSGGALGVATTDSSVSTPVQVDQASWKSVTAGTSRTCGIRADDSLWCWGYDISDTPQKVGSAQWRSVTIGNRSTCGIQTDGTAWCWGDNSAGQLGDGTTTSRPAPVQVGTATSWRTLSSDGSNNSATTCGTRTDGSAWCWGSNDVGQLGNGTLDASLVPTRVDSTTTWSSVSVGGSFACGVKNDGTQRCWGSGYGGELGTGNENDVTVPTRCSEPDRPRGR